MAQPTAGEAIKELRQCLAELGTVEITPDNEAAVKEVLVALGYQVVNLEVLAAEQE